MTRWVQSSTVAGRRRRHAHRQGVTWVDSPDRKGRMKAGTRAPFASVQAAMLGLAAASCIFPGCGDASGDQRVCLPVECNDWLRVTIKPANGALAAGNYEFGITADGKSLTITCEVPVSGTPQQCSTTSGDQLQVDVGVYADRSAIGLTFYWQVAAVDIIVRIDGNPAGSSTFQPQYSTYPDPNFPDEWCTVAPAATMNI